MFDTMKNLMDNQRKIELKKALPLEEVHRILLEKMHHPEIGPPELKKGFLGQSIVFPEVARETPQITVKDNVVTLKKITNDSKTTISVGKFGKVLDKDLRGLNALGTVKSGAAYFQMVASAVEEALADY